METTQLYFVSTDEQINKMWYIHIMDYYSAIKMNEVWIHATTLINLESIMLNDGTQSQKPQSVRLYSGQTRQIHRQK